MKSGCRDNLDPSVPGRDHDPVRVLREAGQAHAADFLPERADGGELLEELGAGGVVARGDVDGEGVDDEGDVAVLAPPGVVALEELRHEFEQAWNEERGVGAVGAADPRDHVPQMARRRRQCGPGGDDGAMVHQAVELVRDVRLGTTLTGYGVAYFVSALPASV